MDAIIHHPFAYKLGPLEITGFGIAMVLSFMIAQFICETLMTRRGYDPSVFGDITVAAVIGGIGGAKIYYVFLTRDIADLFSRGGFVFWGGLIGGIVACFLVIQFKKLRFTQISDVAAPGLAAAYAVGRTGCWTVGDDYGLPYNGPLAVAFPEGAPPSTAAVMERAFGVQFPPGTLPEQVIAVHPTQLYQVSLALMMFALLWRYRDHKHAEGWLFGLYCVLAGAERFIIEFFRAKDDRIFGVLTMAQLIAIAFMVAGYWWMQQRKTPGPGKPAPGVKYVAR
jgi:phosphatidylglycerol:prolipoprotein diacylglycerol transferase